jgi:hypothetical protein
MKLKLPCEYPALLSHDCLYVLEPFRRLRPWQLSHTLSNVSIRMGLACPKECRFEEIFVPYDFDEIR